jgi:AmmeMemoRadiSam system protein B
MMSEAGLRIRQPRFADNRWYSASGSQLRTEVEGYLVEAAGEPNPAGLIGLVAPHAGHLFSGHVAGAAFAGLRPGAFKTVVLLGPDHRGAAKGHIASLEVDLWRTPLGDILVAWEVLQALQDGIELTLLQTDEEHSLEIELPFLQLTLEQFRLAPLMIGDPSPQTCRRLGQALVKALNTAQAGSTLFVASSDLSHFFQDDTARRLDRTTLQFILDLNADGLLDHVEDGRRQGRPLACGAGPIATMIHAAKTLGAARTQLLKYATSADVHPRKDQVVGYAAVAIRR